MIRATRTPLPAAPGRVARHDYESERGGVCKALISVEPLAGKRLVRITARKTRTERANFLQEIAGEYPAVERITLVTDQLNIHGPGSCDEAFPPDEAKKLWDRFEFVDTPKHGSGLEMAEIELNVLIKQCLDRRIDNGAERQAEAAAWQNRRNNTNARID